MSGYWRFKTALACASVLTGCLFGWGGCATQPVEAVAELPAPIPNYVQVSHPNGLDLGDLIALFQQQGAPDRAKLQGCEADFTKLRSMSPSRDELVRGAEELVK